MEENLDVGMSVAGSESTLIGEVLNVNTQFITTDCRLLANRSCLYISVAHCWRTD